MTAAVTQSLKGYFGTKRVQLTFTSNVVGAPKTYATLDDVVAAIEDARSGAAPLPHDDDQTAKHFPKIARNVGKRYFLGDTSVKATKRSKPPTTSNEAVSDGRAVLGTARLSSTPRP